MQLPQQNTLPATGNGFELDKVSAGSGSNPGPNITLKSTTPETTVGTGRTVIQHIDDQGTIAHSVEMGGADKRLKLYTYDGSTLRWRLGVLQGAVGTAEVQISDANLDFFFNGANPSRGLFSDSLFQFLAAMAIQGPAPSPSAGLADIGPNGGIAGGSTAGRWRWYGTDRGDSNPEYMDIQSLATQDFRLTVTKSGTGTLRPFILFMGATEALRIQTATPFVKFNEAATGAKSNSLGANGPNATATPYTWLKFAAPDGTTVYVPAWA